MNDRPHNTHILLLTYFFLGVLEAADCMFFLYLISSSEKHGSRHFFSHNSESIGYVRKCMSLSNSNNTAPSIGKLSSWICRRIVDWSVLNAFMLTPDATLNGMLLDLPRSDQKKRGGEQVRRASSDQKKKGGGSKCVELILISLSLHQLELLQ